MATNLWNIGAGVVGGAIGNWQRNRYNDRVGDAANNSWNQSKFTPYNINSGVANTTFNGTTGTGKLNPRYQAEADRYRNLGNRFLSGLNNGNLNSMRDQQLALLRKLAGTDEMKDTTDMQTMLFNKGLLGSTGGGIQMNALQDAQSQADLMRQLESIKLAQTERDSLFRLGTAAHGFDLDMQGMPLRQLGIGADIGGQASNANYTAGRNQFDASVGAADSEANFWNSLINGGTQAASLFGDASTAGTVGDVMSGLFNAGGGNPIAGAGLIGKETLGGTGSWGDLGTGARSVAKMPTSGLAGSAPGTSILGYGAGGLANPLFAAGGGGAASTLVGTVPAESLSGAMTGWTPFGTNTVPALSAGGTPTTTGATAVGMNPATWGAWGLAAPIAMIGIGKAIAGAIKSSRGGSAESAKIGKLTEQLQRDAASDPTGAASMRTIDKLLTGGLWRGEGNQWVVDELMKGGAIDAKYPTLYTKNSIINLDMAPGHNTEASTRVFSQLANIPKADAEKLAAYNRGVSSANRNKVSGDQGTLREKRTAQRLDTSTAEYSKLVNKYMPTALKSAIKLRDSLLAADPKADVTKLTKFISKPNSTLFTTTRTA